MAARGSSKPRMRLDLLKAGEEMVASVSASSLPIHWWPTTMTADFLDRDRSRMLSDTDILLDSQTLERRIPGIGVEAGLKFCE